LPQFLLLLLTVVFAAKAVGALIARSRHPAVFGKILIGLLPGPTAIDLLRL
jgi:Kef-type K+ transport system membrane component KefB